MSRSRSALPQGEADVSALENVKAVLDVNGYAIYFSRAMIPHNKKGTYQPQTAYWRKLARGGPAVSRRCCACLCLHTAGPVLCERHMSLARCSLSGALCRLLSCTRVGARPLIFRDLDSHALPLRLSPQGIYCYRSEFLPKFLDMPESKLQSAEDLEQNKARRIFEQSNYQSVEHGLR